MYIITPLCSTLYKNMLTLQNVAVSLLESLIQITLAFLLVSHFSFLPQLDISTPEPHDMAKLLNTLVLITLTVVCSNRMYSILIVPR